MRSRTGHIGEVDPADLNPVRGWGANWWISVESWPIETGTRATGKNIVSGGRSESWRARCGAVFKLQSS
jgi:hypothetical protein